MGVTAAARHEGTRVVKRGQRRTAAGKGRREGKGFFASLEPRLKGLFNFARREIAYRETSGDLLPGEVTPDLVVDEAVLHAYQASIADDRICLNLKATLLRFALELLDREAARSRARRPEPADAIQKPAEDATAHVDEVFDVYIQGENANAEDVTARHWAPTREEMLERRELQYYVECAISDLPDLWRRVYVLHEVERIPLADIAEIMARRQPEIMGWLRQARQTVYRRLQEAGFVASRLGVSRLGTMGEADEVGVPDAIRKGIAQRIRRRQTA